VIHLDLRIQNAGRAEAPATQRGSLQAAARDPLLIGATLAALAAFGGVRLGDARLDAHEARVDEESAAAAADAVRLRGSLERVAALTREQARLASTVSAIRALGPDRFAWVRLMDHVGSAAPENVWVERMEMTSQDHATGGVGFRVTGFAPSVELAAAFQRRLAASAGVRDAVLSGTTSTQIASFPVVRYEITGTAGDGTRDPGYLVEQAVATPEPTP
jgi:Tfp pilus assembly protein PilN